MKGQYIKQLHSIGVYRSPKTKQKLECMKLADILQVLSEVQEEMEKGVEYKKKEWDYEFVTPVKKKDKSVYNKKKKGGR